MAQATKMKRIVPIGMSPISGRELIILAPKLRASSISLATASYENQQAAMDRRLRNTNSAVISNPMCRQ